MPSSDTRSSRLARWLAPIAELRPGEGGTALLLFLYSFLAMTSYNIVKPVTRSQFITSLGADNLPWVQFGSGVLIGFIMQGYTMARNEYRNISSAVDDSPSRSWTTALRMRESREGRSANARILS